MNKQDAVEKFTGVLRRSGDLGSGRHHETFNVDSISTLRTACRHSLLHIAYLSSPSKNMAMKPLIVVFCIFLSAAPLYGQEKLGQLPEFTSAEAITAVEQYEEKLAFLDARLAEKVEEAQTALLADLQHALQIAVADRDFPEVQRLSEFLQASQAKVPSADNKAPQSDPAEPAVTADTTFAASLDDPEEVRKRLDLQLTAVKAQAIADFEQIARKAVAEGKLDRAEEIWEEVLGLDLGNQEARKFFSQVKRTPAPLPANDRRNVWQSDGEPNIGFMKTRTGWVRFADGKPMGQLEEIDRTEHTITFRSGNDLYNLHRDAMYGRGGALKWEFHGTGRWLR